VAGNRSRGWAHARVGQPCSIRLLIYVLYNKKLVDVSFTFLFVSVRLSYIVSCWRYRASLDWQVAWLPRAAGTQQHQSSISESLHTTQCMHTYLRIHPLVHRFDAGATALDWVETLRAIGRSIFTVARSSEQSQPSYVICATYVSSTYVSSVCVSL
jgi:hypothetical protein